MGRRGRSTSVGKFAKIHHNRRVSEIRVLGELLRRERLATPVGHPAYDARPDRPDVSRSDD